MPELPEVERARRLLEHRCVGHYITHLAVNQDAIVFCGVAASAFTALIGRRVLSVGRRGKHFYLQFDQPPALVCHFGMTGNIQFIQETPFNYRRLSKKINEEKQWPPRFWKLKMQLSPSPQDCPTDDDIQWAFTDPRRLGRIRLVEDPLSQPPISNLGFDPIVSMPDLKIFSELIRQRRTTIKALLLDQKFSAGVGNWVADEVLYQSRIHPGRTTQSLTDEEIGQLHYQLKHVCETACLANADPEQFPKDWIFHRRWKKGREALTMSDQTSKQCAGPVTLDGHPIVFETHGGRTSAIVPALQKLHPTSLVTTSTCIEAEQVNGKSTNKSTTRAKRTAVSRNVSMDTTVDDDDDVPTPKQTRSKRKNTRLV